MTFNDFTTDLTHVLLFFPELSTLVTVLAVIALVSVLAGVERFLFRSRVSLLRVVVVAVVLAVAAGAGVHWYRVQIIDRVEIGGVDEQGRVEVTITEKEE